MGPCRHVGIRRRTMAIHVWASGRVRFRRSRFVYISARVPRAGSHCSSFPKLAIAAAWFIRDWYQIPRSRWRESKASACSRPDIRVVRTLTRGPTVHSSAIARRARGGALCDAAVARLYRRQPGQHSADDVLMPIHWPASASTAARELYLKTKCP